MPLTVDVNSVIMCVCTVSVGSPQRESRTILRREPSVRSPWRSSGSHGNRPSSPLIRQGSGSGSGRGFGVAIGPNDFAGTTPSNRIGSLLDALSGVPPRRWISDPNRSVTSITTAGLACPRLKQLGDGRAAGPSAASAVDPSRPPLPGWHHGISTTSCRSRRAAWSCLVSTAPVMSSVSGKRSDRCSISLQSRSSRHVLPAR